MKLVFAGTPDFAASHLQALIDAKHQVLAVYTQPDRPAGRGKKLQASAVKQLAQLHNIPVEQPLNFKEPDSITTLQEYECDLMVVVAYGLLLPQDVLDTPRFGCINVHGSLLPRWRGAAPIQRAIWAGDATSGVCIMQMDIGLDTGPVLLQKEIDIDNNDTSASLYSKLAALGPEALLACLDDFASLTPKIQNDAQASYAKKLSKQEARCDWSQPVEQLERNVRAFNPWPMAWFVHEEKAIKVHKAKAVVRKHTYPLGTIIEFTQSGLHIAVSGGVFCITELQLPGKKPQQIDQLVNGNKLLFKSGDILPPADNPAML